MRDSNTPLLIRCYKDVGHLVELSLPEWELLIRQGRRSRLLGRLHAMADDAGLLGKIPKKPLDHLMAARVEADRVNAAARWEAGQIAQALSPLVVPIIALKGGAYALSEMPVARGRVFSDLDLLVPKSALEDVERRLFTKGWLSTHLDAYDQHYYRQWMHEIPPMRHVQRKTNLDIHHGLLPETVAGRPDPLRLFADAVPVGDLENVYVLSPADMWLHSAAHLFQEGEFHNALRDLTDLDLLSRELSREPDFWHSLAGRAISLKLTRQLYYGLRFLRDVLDTPIPEALIREAEVYSPAKPIRMVMDKLYREVFRPFHASCDTLSGPVARFMLYIRSHAIRMPPHLLLPHLAHKAFISPYKDWREERARKKIQVLEAN